ncbi:hypothetical protein C8F04DRAFT_47019 [Mycena alexandri]|uniref:Uncharacterized protein n=1 Tax=Mycena alexandri TaxID=1745969 RepID=A0AAD6SMQ2_9AGAR|nr:hypothetical protein C8F04DRAFT_47019 [Mycena alexandri]
MKREKKSGLEGPESPRCERCKCASNGKGRPWPMCWVAAEDIRKALSSPASECRLRARQNRPTALPTTPVSKSPPTTKRTSRTSPHIRTNDLRRFLNPRADGGRRHRLRAHPRPALSRVPPNAVSATSSVSLNSSTGQLGSSNGTVVPSRHETLAVPIGLLLKLEREVEVVELGVLRGRRPRTAHTRAPRRARRMRRPVRTRVRSMVLTSRPAARLGPRRIGSPSRSPRPSAGRWAGPPTRGGDAFCERDRAYSRGRWGGLLSLYWVFLFLGRIVFALRLLRGGAFGKGLPWPLPRTCVAVLCMQPRPLPRSLSCCGSFIFGFLLVVQRSLPSFPKKEGGFFHHPF